MSTIFLPFYLIVFVMASLLPWLKSRADILQHGLVNVNLSRCIYSETKNFTPNLKKKEMIIATREKAILCRSETRLIFGIVMWNPLLWGRRDHLVWYSSFISVVFPTVFWEVTIKASQEQGLSIVYQSSYT